MVANDHKRQSGRTTQQMIEAPQDAMYIWVNGRLTYPKSLAKFLNREDLQIVSPQWVIEKRWMGHRDLKVVMDHAINLPPSDYSKFLELRSYLNV